MAENKSSKTEKPTPRKLRKAREKGQIARSRDIPAAAVLLGVVLILYYFGRNIVHGLELEMLHMFRMKTPSELSILAVTTILRDISFRIAIIIVPLLFGIVFLSVGSNAAQGGFAISNEALKLHFDKLNPSKGFKRIFSKNGLVQMAKSLAIMVVVSIVCWQVVNKHMTLFPRLVLMDVRQLFYWVGTISYEILIRVAVLMVILAIADYFFQKYQFTEQLKMSKQEIKDEHKEMEGDPITKGRIRRIQREMARKRMMNEVATADVVITNPTHYAVALSYKMGSMEAPKVVAKGADFLAQRIRELAREHDVPLVENPPLARTLYKTVKVGSYIPGELYRTVAEILAYIFKARNMYYNR